MGQTHSDNTNLQKPFSLKCHHSTCSLKQAIQQNDYYSFHQELKSRLHSMGLSARRLHHPSDYVATINSSFEHCDTISGILKENVKLYAFNRRLSSSLMHLDIDDNVDDKSNMIWNGDKLLTCKIGECKKAPGEFTGRVMLYVPCLCPGRYAALDINNLDRTGRTALNVAIRKRDNILVKLYLYCGANPNMWNQFGETPLHMASAMGFLKAVQLLLEANADVNAVDEPPPQLLIQSKETAIMTAALNGHALCIAELLKSGADANLQNRDGYTALHNCAKYGYKSCVSILLKKKVYVNIRNNEGVTPLQLALLHIKTDVARILVNYGCDVTSYSKDLLSILSLSAMCGELSLVEKCIKEGVKVNKLDIFNKTALYYTFTLDSYIFKKLPIFASHACRFDVHLQIPNRKEIVELLIRNGANVESVLAECLQDPTRDVLNKKHFSLPGNIAIFQRIIQACGFQNITVIEVDDLFWHMLSDNGKMLAKLLLFAMPRLDHKISKRLSNALDWTGAHTEDAIYVHLEAAGSDLETSNWICKRIKQPRSLQEWSRDSVRIAISCNIITNVQELRIPHMLKNYICLRDVLAI